MLLQEYTPEWIRQFEQIKVELESALKGLECTIEHVGSTAVPNLAAKPIIDIDIIFQKNAEFEKIKFNLIQVGYYHNGNQGIEEREVFKRNGAVENHILDRIKHHLYVCPNDSKALSRHLLFRDCLRTNDTARLKYHNMKYAIAIRANQDKKKYADLKELTVNEFIDELIGIKKTKKTNESSSPK